jgi:hypothetical protein
VAFGARRLMITWAELNAMARKCPSSNVAAGRMRTPKARADIAFCARHRHAIRLWIAYSLNLQTWDAISDRKLL